MKPEPKYPSCQKCNSEMTMHGVCPSCDPALAGEAVRRYAEHLRLHPESRGNYINV